MASEKKEVSINDWINEEDAPLHYWCIIDAPADLRLQKIEAALKGGHNYLVNELDHTKDPKQNRGTPLHCALDSRSARQQDNRAIINLLLKYGADPRIKDAKGRSAIDLCSSSSSKQYNIPDPVLNLRKEILPQLEELARRFDFDSRSYGHPFYDIYDEPIGFRWPIFKAAIDAGDDVNKIDPYHDIHNQGTPLHCAVSEGSARPQENIEIVKLLLARGADPRIKDKRGRYTPIEDVQGNMRADKDRDDCGFWKTYLELMEDAARKLSGKSKWNLLHSSNTP